MPTCAHSVLSSPMLQLCPICTRLSIFVPDPIVVEPVTARSIAEHAPISTRSPTTTLPSCGILICSRPTRTKPKPSAPMTQFACKMQSSPTTQSASTHARGCSSVRAPIAALGPTYEPANKMAPSPRRAPAPMTTAGPIHTPAPRVTPASNTALGCVNSPCGSGGANEARIAASAARTSSASRSAFGPRSTACAARGTITADARDASARAIHFSSTANVSAPGAASSTDETRSIAIPASPASVAPASAARSPSRCGAVVTAPCSFRRRRRLGDVQRLHDVRGDVVAAVGSAFFRDDDLIIALLRDVGDRGTHVVGDFVVPAFFLVLELRESLALLRRADFALRDRLIICLQLIVIILELGPIRLKLAHADDGDARMRLCAAAERERGQRERGRYDE